MMKRIFGAGVAIAALVTASSAFAATTEGDTTATVTVNGHVDAACSIATTSDTIDLGSLTNSDGSFNTASVPSSFNVSDTMWCNGVNSKATLSATALADTSPGTSSPPSGFSNAVNYKVTAVIGGVSVSSGDTATSGAGVATLVGAFSQTNTLVTPSVDTVSGKLLAGSYSGSVSLTLSPAI